MTRSGRLATAAAAVVVLGVAAALVATLLAPASGGPQRWPAEALALPADAPLVAVGELQALRRAGLAERLAALLPGSTGGLSADLDGLDGVERAVYASSPLPGGIGVGIVSGGFDVPRALERVRRAGAVERAGLLLLEREGDAPVAVAAAPTGTGVIAGEPESVAAVRDALAAGHTRLDLARLAPVLDALPPGAAAWAIATGDALEALRRLAGEAPLPLPALPELKGAGAALELQAVPTLELVLLAVDEAGAQQLTDTLRGLLALAQMAAPPEWRAALAELALAREATLVRLRIRLPMERLDALLDSLPPGTGNR